MFNTYALKVFLKLLCIQIETWNGFLIRSVLIFKIKVIVTVFKGPFINDVIHIERGILEILYKQEQPLPPSEVAPQSGA